MKAFTFIHRFYQLLVLFFLLGLMACAPGDTTYAGGGIGGTGVISTGTITEIGSIWVNGVKYDTAGATITINDAPVGSGNQAVFDYLTPGLLVGVNGRVTGNRVGKADSVTYISTLVGPIQAIDTVLPHDRLFQVLGQDVVVNGETVLQDGALEDFTLGNLVEVSGLVDNTGKIVASYVAKIAETALPGDVLRVTGIISLLDEDQTTFFMNGLKVDYASAALSGALPSLKNDAWVHVTGYFSEDPEPLFAADQIHPFDRIGEDQGKAIEIEGIVRTDLWANQFKLEKHTVEVGSMTEFYGGTVAEIFAGTRVEVEGTFSGDVLLADYIKFKTSFQAESNLAEKNIADQTFVLSGMEDLVIAVNSLTQWNGIHKSFEELTVGDHLTVRGWIASDRKMIANQVISNAAGSTKVTLIGSVSNLNNTFITINTLVIDSAVIPGDGFFTQDKAPITRDDFLSQIKIGNTVAVLGELTAHDAVSWNRMAISEK